MGPKLAPNALFSLCTKGIKKPEVKKDPRKTKRGTLSAATELIVCSNQESVIYVRNIVISHLNASLETGLLMQQYVRKMTPTKTTTNKQLVALL